MEIDETWRNGKPAAIENLAVSRRDHGADLRDAIPINQQISADRFRAGPVEKHSVPED
ncbi:MAG TPA: hypothetical protein VG345_01115 [Bryobacteraceae bacterium]|jgi:hypothetical protein|nr:hypothetical protein [Bryobacteraceae bacterium]